MVSPRSRAKVRSLGLRIRQLREEADRSQTWVAGQLKGFISSSAFNRFEMGKGWPIALDLAEGITRILLALGVRGDEFLAIMKLVEDTAHPNWLAVGRDLAPQLAAFLDYEAAATQITSLTTVVFPGLMQTREYAEEVFRGSDMPDDEQRERTRIRLARQRALEKVRFTVILDEAVLGRQVGTTITMADQIRLAISLGRQDNIDFRILPRGRAALVTNGGYDLMEFKDQPPVAYSEHAFGGIIIDEPDRATHLMQRTTRVLSAALSSADSAELMNTTLNELTTETGV